jgi:pyruvate/2-oxoacid:ferredoxin oxidoreductase alpha subunit
MKVAMTEKRWKKLENFFEKEGITGYDVYNNEAKKMIVTTSYTIYTAKEFIKNNPEFGLIIIHFLKPFDGRLLDELK